MKSYTDHRANSAAYLFGKADLSLYVAREMATERRAFLGPSGWLKYSAPVRRAINRQIRLQAAGAVCAALKGLVLARAGILT